MDQNLKYVKQQRIALLLNEMVVHLLGARPEDPLTSLITYLEVKKASGSVAPKEPGVLPARQAGEAEAVSQPSPAAEPAAAATQQEQQAAPETEKEQDAAPAAGAADAEDGPSTARCCEKAFPVGCEVDIVRYSEELNGQRGRVVGTSRGRVGVEFYDSIAPMSLPAPSVRRVVTPEQQLPKGTPVAFVTPHGLAGWAGVVESHHRGRVGVRLSDGELVGTVAPLLRRVDADVRQAFPLGVLVELLQGGDAGALGVVVGHSRGRIGVELSATAKAVGLTPAAVRLVGKSAAQAFPVDSRVECIDIRKPELNGKEGVVTGHGRGRVGVLLDDGTALGLLPHHLRPKAAALQINDEVEVVSPDSQHTGLSGYIRSLHRGRIGLELSTGETAGVLPQHVRRVSSGVRVGARVELLAAAGAGICGESGTVTSCARGRVGVELTDGTTRGVPLGCVRVVPTPAIALHSDVEVLAGPHRGQTGQVTGLSRGRVGVEVDGHAVGLPVSMVRALPPMNAQRMSVGSRVAVIGGTAHRGSEGRVSGHARGRVGVELESGERVGFVPHHLRVVPKSAAQELPIGCDVCVVASSSEHNGKQGQVLGHSRGRVGVELPDGRHGFPSDMLRKVQKSARQLLPVGVYVDVTHPQYSGQHGQVLSHNRGRVAVLLQDGTTIGVPSGAVRRALPTPQMFPVGCSVSVSCPASEHYCDEGVVVGHSRGRVGVDLRGGAHAGFPCTSLKKTPQSTAREFPLGARVMIVNEIPEQNGRLGKVVGVSRGRVGIELLDGTLIGVPQGSLRSAGPVPEQFPVGCYVCVSNEDPAMNGRVAQVMGHSRGRVGLVLEDGVQCSAPLQHVKKEPVTAAQEFAPGTVVEVVKGDLCGNSGPVTGVARGRVGVEIGPDGHVEGFPGSMLRVASKMSRNEFPMDSFAEVKTGKDSGLVGRVTGHERGRVSLAFTDGTTAGFPAGQLKSAAPSALFCVGTSVVVVSPVPALNGQEATVTGVSRGRVGLSLLDGREVGLPYQQVRLQKNAANGFREGDQVVVVAGSYRGEAGPVVGVSRGRVGVCIGPDSRVVGVPAAVLRAVGKTAKQAFPVGTAVVHDGRLATVTNHNRGRVGVEYDDGTTAGVPAALLGRRSNFADQDFPVGATVQVTGKSNHAGTTGRVISQARGRVAVLCENDERIAVPAGQLQLVPAMSEQQFPVGAFVTIVAPGTPHNGQDGRVTGTSRGRVGVALLDGGQVGLPAQQLRASGKSTAQAFAAGDKVEVIAGEYKGETGNVTHTRGGRVGVQVGPDNHTIGLPAGQLRAIPKQVSPFPVGTTVCVQSGKLAGQEGTAVSFHRGRVGVDLDNGERVGLPVSLLRPTQKSAAQAFPAGQRVEVTGGPTAGQTGTVTGHARGRAAVLLDSDGGVVGIPATLLRCMAATETAHFEDGQQVEVVCKGITGTVKGKARGRVSVEVDGELQSFPASQLRHVHETRKGFPVGTNVHVVHPGHPQCGMHGTVKEEAARGRLAVDIEGTTYGLNPGSLRAVPQPVDPKTGDTIKYRTSPGDAAQLATATVAQDGTCRGRVAVTVEDKPKSVPIPLVVEWKA